MGPFYQSLLAFYPCDDPQFCHNLFMKRGNTRFQQQIYSRTFLSQLFLGSGVETVLVRPALGPPTAPWTCPPAALKAHCARPASIFPNYQCPTSACWEAARIKNVQHSTANLLCLLHHLIRLKTAMASLWLSPWRGCPFTARISSPSKIRSLFCLLLNQSYHIHSIR